MAHFTWTLMLAILISAATALPGNRATHERACAAAYTFLSCTLTVFAGSWIMHFIHG
jgi:hypothetical protein